MGYNLCGEVFAVHDVVQVCVDASASRCVASLLSYTQCSGSRGSSGNYTLPLYLFDRGADGWQGAGYAISTRASSGAAAVVAAGTLDKGFDQVGHGS